MWRWTVSKEDARLAVLTFSVSDVPITGAFRNTRHWPAVWSQSGSALSFSPPHQSNARASGHQLSMNGLVQKGGGQRSSRNSQRWAWRRTIFTSEIAGYFGLETDVIFTFCTAAFFTSSTKLSKPQSGSLILDHDLITEGASVFFPQTEALLCMKVPM